MFTALQNRRKKVEYVSHCRYVMMNARALEYEIFFLHFFFVLLKADYNMF